MPGEALGLTNISVRFGGLQALSEVTCRMASETLTGVIGPNGAGKTTLLNVISGLVPATGRVQLGNQVISGLPAHKRPRLGLARTFQSLELAPDDTLAANVAVGGTIQRRCATAWTFFGDLRGRREERHVRHEVLGLLELLGIAEWSEVRMRSIPYVIQKRAQIARALMLHPKVLLLDEPASGMSPTEKLELREVLSTLSREKRLTMVVIEHDIGFLTGCCENLVALNFGKVIAQGSAQDVVANQKVIDSYLGTTKAATA